LAETKQPIVGSFVLFQFQNVRMSELKQSGQALLSITDREPYQIVLMFNINAIWPYAKAGYRAVPVADWLPSSHDSWAHSPT